MKIFFILYLIHFINLINTEKCTRNWIEFKSSCYKFSRSPRRNYDEAENICRQYGSTLVSINSYEENQFIIQWLSNNDPQHIKWLTSGREQTNNIWKWEGDKTIFPNINQLWLSNDGRVSNSLKFAAFNFSLQENRWGLIRIDGNTESGYICEINKNDVISIVEDRSIDYGFTVLDPEMVPRGPKFIEEPKDVIFDLSGRSYQNYATLRCIASGYPPPQYQWYKEEYAEQSMSEVLIEPLKDNRLTLTDGSLLIYNPTTIKDKGKYFCKATNEFGTIISQSIELSFGFIGEFMKIRSPDYARTNWGKSLSCDEPLHNPKVNYYWNKNQLFSFVEEDRRVFVSHDGNLYFSSIEVIDAANYSCNVRSSISSTGRTGPFFTLNVESVPNNQKLQFPNNFPKVFPDAPLAGQQVRLECVAYGYPAPNYNWTRLGLTNRLPDGSYTTNNNRVLMIPKVKVEDGGDYICTATSGLEVIYKTVSLSVQSLPIFTLPLTDMVMSVGDTLVWTCEAFGIPEVTYTWYKDGSPIKTTNFKFINYKINDNILTISDLNPETDNGMFQCKASNQLGIKYSSAQLKIMSLKPTFAKRPLEREIYASVGGNLTIPCSPEAVPFPSFSWRRNGANLASYPGGRIKILPSGYLFISPVDKADEGEYVCIATNTYGSDQSTGYLIVYHKPHIIQFPDPKIVVYINKSIEIPCEAHTDNSLDIAYIWTHNQLRINFTQMLQFSIGKTLGTLAIKNVTLAEAGHYTCIVKTPIGQTETETEIVVVGPPNSPGAVSGEILSSTKAKIEWSDGSDNGRAILAYLIEGKTNHNSTWVSLANYISRVNVDQQTSRRYTTLDNLSPWSKYHFRVTAINELGHSIPSESSPVFGTGKGKPFKFPSRVGGGGGKTGTLTITWNPLPPQDWNAPSIWYIVYYKLANSEAEYLKVNLSKYGNIGMYTISVGDDNYYTKYLVRVQGENEIGEGPISPEQEIYSAESMPQIQPSLVRALAFNSTAINVTWAPLDLSREKIRGKLIGHRIKYWINGRDPQTDALTLLSRGQKKWGIIVALLADTEYYLSVMAYNDAGSGPESEPFLVKTYKSAPQQAPSGVKVTSIGENSVRVVWRGINEVTSKEEAIIGYKVRYWEEDQPITSAKEVYKYLDGSDLEAIISGLSRGKNYKLRVLGYSKGGDGKMSSPANLFKIAN